MSVANINGNASFEASLQKDAKEEGVLMISKLKYKDISGSNEETQGPKDIVTIDKIPVKYAIIVQGGLYDARTLVEITRTADFQRRKEIVDKRRELLRQVFNDEIRDWHEGQRHDRFGQWTDANYFPNPIIPHNNSKLPQFVSAVLHQVAIALTSQPRIIYNRINKKKRLRLKIAFENIWISCMNGQIRTYGTYVIVKENVENILASAVQMSQSIYESLRGNQQLRDAFHPSNNDHVNRAFLKTLIVKEFISNIDFKEDSTRKINNEVRVRVRRDLTIPIAFSEASLTPRSKEALERLNLHTMVMDSTEGNNGHSVDVILKLGPKAPLRRNRLPPITRPVRATVSKKDEPSILSAPALRSG